MLFLDSKILNHSVNEEARVTLLHALQKRDFKPLIRSLRIHCFEELLIDSDRLADVENTMVRWTASSTEEPFVVGDLFAFEGYLLYLIFEAEGFVTAGIVYETDTPEPFRKLNTFCQDIRSLLITAQEETTGMDVINFPEWEAETKSMPQGFRTFVEKQDSDSLFTNLRKEMMTRRIIAASSLEDEGARLFLRSARNAHEEGCAVKLLSGDTQSESVPIQRLEDVGLVEREVQVSCRKTGHALFRLPNAGALAVVTVSDATCSECGSPVADENVQEVIAPTPLATSLLEDGSWLLSRIHSVLRDLGVPEREIAVGPSEGTGFGQMMANISGESFLITTRDGDLTPPFARWSVDLEVETETSHLVIVATGRIHKEAGLLLRNHSRRRVSSGQDFEMILADDVASASHELRGALDRVSQRIIAEQLCVLDSSLGMSASKLVSTKFQLRKSDKSQPAEPVVESPAEWSSTPAPLALAAAASVPFTPDVVALEPEIIVPVDEIYPEPHQDIPQFQGNFE